MSPTSRNRGKDLETGSTATRGTASGWKKPALAIGLLAALAVAGYAGFQVWRRHQLSERVQEIIRVAPETGGLPGALVERLEKARALAASPEHSLEGVAELGRLYHANGFLRQAEACWQLLRAAQPGEPRWCYYLADLARTASDYPQMTAMLEETTKLAPDYSPAWLQLAGLQFKTGRKDEAVASYKKRQQLVPGDPYARLGLARVAMQDGNRDEARDILVKLVKDAPGFSSGHNLYAEILAADGREEEAARERNLGRETGRFREADDPWLDELQAWCFEPGRLALIGTMQFQTNYGDRGVGLMKRAVELAPDVQANYEALGTLYLKLGKPVEAQAVFERALRLPTLSEHPIMLQVNLAEAFRLQQKPLEALRVVKAALIGSPKAFELHNELGAVLVDLGQVEESLQAYREAVALAPNDTDSNFSLGSALLALGRRDEAVDYLKRSLKLQPTFPKTLIVLGRLALAEGRLDDARSYLQPLYDSHPEQALARQLIARYHFMAGETAASSNDLVSAERHYREGLATDPDNVDINASLGVLCLLKGRPADALTPFEAYHRLRPEDPHSSLFLGQVYAQLGRFAEARRILTEGRDLAERAGNTVTAQHCREILDHLPPVDFRPPPPGG